MDYLLIFLFMGFLISFLARIISIKEDLILILLLILIIADDGCIINHNYSDIAVNTSLIIILFSSLISIRNLHKSKGLSWILATNIIPATLIGAVTSFVFSDGIQMIDAAAISGSVLLFLTLLTIYNLIKLSQRNNTLNKNLIFRLLKLDSSKILNVIMFLALTISVALISLTIIEDYESYNLYSPTWIIKWLAILCILPIKLIGSYLGSKYLHRLSNKYSKFLFAGILSIIGSTLLFI
ncbi:sulfite exporter TauE/SafE family protein [Francisella frigiditurris]|uniref:Sulfite exporter TauE/SafE family protein n=1 Tax=Francisella frigiditurris TaxID=1542390 RepID=A0A1J0KVJ8_9GAMM|nr:sulfite exporter TauE/SafE family protein [Francisella frigiditurris]APC97813.1 sulfite exporter TauE/SafE family protein [Francisella frigiditurris]